MKDLEFTFECTPELKEKIKKGSKDCSLSESKFIAACIEFFSYKNSSCQNKKEGLPFK